MARAFHTAVFTTARAGSFTVFLIDYAFDNHSEKGGGNKTCHDYCLPCHYLTPTFVFTLTLRELS